MYQETNQRESCNTALSSWRASVHGALYTGMTEDLASIVCFDHKCNLVAGITSQYAIHLLVYYEHHVDAESATLA